ncbi:ANTAR domain-containing protein [Amycolatopsis japonica]|uniref:ANTAR domain-containing protein n=1 Tax=Amycolatopsis japonica TaxID=208439 RepID=UPI00332E9C93
MTSPADLPGYPGDRPAALREALAALTTTRAGVAGRVAQAALLLEHSVRLIPAAAIGVELPDDQRLLQTAGASTEAAWIFASDADHAHGPSSHAFISGRTVTVADLTAGDSAWPLQRAPALVAGYAMLLAVPIRHNGVVFGVVVFYHTGQNGFSVDDHATAQALADAAALGLTHLGSGEAGTTLADRIEQAFTRGVRIEQASGVLAELRNITPNQALALLRRHAHDHHRTVAELARHLLETRDWPPPD